MALEETISICLAVVATSGICAIAYYASEVNRERIQQAGIDKRKGVSQTTYAGKDWWVPVIQELAKNPQVVEAITKLMPQVLEIVERLTPPKK